MVETSPRYLCRLAARPVYPQRASALGWSVGMDEVSGPSWWAWVARVLNTVFAITAVLAFAYVMWRGFVAESGKRPVPLFGEVTKLEWEGRECEFVLLRYADLEKVRPGELLIQQGEPAPTVWRVVAREEGRLRLEHPGPGHTRRTEIALPQPEGGPRYV
ncbi:MAG: hypothetical protein QHJ73_12520, partial [Armatimonadota bacterium]|nr:hypothetical protein [Armatimonadota bacterium]